MDNNQENSSNNIKILTGGLFEKTFRLIQIYSLAAISFLILAVFFLIYDLRLAAGASLIVTSALGILIFRKATGIIKLARESITDFSASNEKKDDVIISFSHKIREPLNNIVIIAEMLHDPALPKKQKDLLETLVASTNNMVTTVNELTMQSAGNLSFGTRKNIRFNLLSTVQNTIDLYKLKNRENIEFIIDNKDLHELECFGDPIILKQIFLEIFNTVDNSGTNLPTRVNISMKSEKLSGSEVSVELQLLSDRPVDLVGEGQINRSLTSRLIETSRGRYIQEIGPDSTILKIKIPFFEIIQEKRIQIGSSKIEELIQKDKVNKELKDIKVLLVEDNFINQKITLLTLKPLVFSIDTASNGKEALDKFGTTNYDIILMDIQMPVMSGLVAAEKIRALEITTNTHVPIIAITANAMLGDKEKCISVGIDDYISKPFQPSALIEIIKKYI